MIRRSAILAFFTIGFWSFLALLGSQLEHVPPFLLVGAALIAGSLIGLPKLRVWRAPPKTLLVGVYGIFGYHFLFFSAIQHAPALEANLIQYLWPLLIVLFSPVFLPGFRLRPHHLAGAFLGLAGAVLIVTGGRIDLDLENLPGYLMALGAAVVWSTYSLMTKRVAAFPTALVGAFCLVSGVISLGIYLLQTGSLAGLGALSRRDWLFLALLGLGPMGLAFYTWDAALKQGDPRVIGSLTYVIPLLSTMLLVLVGGREFTWVSAVAMGLILSGALLGSKELFAPREKSSGSMETAGTGKP